MEEPMAPVVVGVDGSAESNSALDLAAQEAASRIAPLAVVHACDPATGGADRLAAAQRILDAAVSRALAEHPALSVTADLLFGMPADALAERARQAGLLVIAHSPRCRARRAGITSMAHRAVSRATVPVIVHRPLSPLADPERPRPVVVGVACAPGDDAVAEFAFQEASSRSAPLQAVHICPGSLHDVADLTGDTLRAWSEKYPEVAVNGTVRHGLDVPVALTAASRSAQLVVVGSRRPDDSSLSVAQILSHRAACPVAVVPVN